jgi:hypothetical protein
MEAIYATVGTIALGLLIAAIVFIGCTLFSPTSGMGGLISIGVIYWLFKS